MAVTDAATEAVLDAVAELAPLDEALPLSDADASAVALALALALALGEGDGVAVGEAEELGDRDAEPVTDADDEAEGDTDNEGVRLSEPNTAIAVGARPAVARACDHVPPSEQLKVERTLTSDVAPGAYTCERSAPTSVSQCGRMSVDVERPSPRRPLSPVPPWS